MDVNDYTPSSPEDLKVSFDTRQDEKGHLHPVVVANWKLKDDGESFCCLEMLKERDGAQLVIL